MRSMPWRVLALVGMTMSAVILAPASAVEAAPLCIREASPSTVTYELRYGGAGETIVIGGARTSLGSPTVPLSGSAYINSQGVIVIGFTVNFDYGSGVWVTPTSDVVIKIAGSTVTYDVTFVPAGSTTPVNRLGTGSIVACSAVLTSAPMGDAGNVSTDPLLRTGGAAAPMTRLNATAAADPEKR
jgi:hypothetical protein